jgi:hypothetical protein
MMRQPPAPSARRMPMNEQLCVAPRHALRSGPFTLMPRGARVIDLRDISLIAPDWDLKM